MAEIVLPWPPAALSGHTGGKGLGRWAKAGITKSLRERAKNIVHDALPIDVPATGDIAISFTFVPPDRRGDRTNMPARLKPLIDGIADALEVNDSRFLPSYHYQAPQKPGCVLVTIGGER